MQASSDNGSPAQVFLTTALDHYGCQVPGDCVNWFSTDTPLSFICKRDCHDISEQFLSRWYNYSDSQSISLSEEQNSHEDIKKFLVRIVSTGQRVVN